MAKANITLRRIEQVTTVNRYGTVGLEVQDRTVGVQFVDCDGNVVSIAFDPRAGSESCGIGSVMKSYRTYSDCPVIADFDGDEEYSGSVSDVQALRVVRDALNKMNLGD
jgi:hypothetical protein